jgi:uncharacterized membrane-anchored protein YjiN (DUF445 family)
VPVPHTALVPRRKDALAASLGEFVTGYFLTADNVRERLAEADVVPRVGVWLCSGDTADRLAREALGSSAAVLDLLDAGDVADLLLEVARRDAAGRSWAALAGSLLSDVTAGGAHRPLVEVALPYVRRSIEQNRATVHATLKAVAEQSSFLAWLFTTDRRIARLVDSGVRLLAQVEADPDHEVRAALDRFLASLAADLRDGGDLAARLDALVGTVLRDPATRSWLVGAVEGGLASLHDTVGDPSGPGPVRLAAAVRRLGQRAVDDAAFRARLQGLLERGVLHVVEHYATEFTRLVEDTVRRWDGPATADRIELAAGRDLQFIRINGTVVGALAGWSSTASRGRWAEPYRYCAAIPSTLRTYQSARL